LNTIDALDYPNLTFKINVVFVSLNILLNVILVAGFGWYGAAAATTVSAAVGTSLGFWYLTNLIEVPLPTREIFNQLLAALVMAALVLPGRLVLKDSLPVGVILAGFGAVVYFTTLLAISQKFRKTVDHNLPFRLPLFSVE
jgi:O-antigen/teichoic acid export membrane protein